MGVTTFDLVLIGKHILGLKALDSPYKMIAADVNRSQRITAIDLIAQRRLILNVDTGFADNTSWRFVPADYQFPDPANPWLEGFPEHIDINALQTGVIGIDFVAIKVGDVSGDADTQATQ